MLATLHFFIWNDTYHFCTICFLTFSDSAVLRVPILYGQVEYLKESAVTVLASALLDTSKETLMCDYQLRYPTHTQDVAVVCRQLADKHLEVMCFD